jgi:hypothetical protein
MNPNVRSRLLVAVAIIAAIGFYVFFSPYQRCTRDAQAKGLDVTFAHAFCATHHK